MCLRTVHHDLCPREVREGADELRLILCRKERNESSSSSVIAACGIYMTDILEAVPIDKYFELFKPVSCFISASCYWPCGTR